MVLLISRFFVGYDIHLNNQMWYLFLHVGLMLNRRTGRIEEVGSTHYNFDGVCLNAFSIVSRIEFVVFCYSQLQANVI